MSTGDIQTRLFMQGKLHRRRMGRKERRMTLDEALEIVRDEYQKALELPWVWSPIAYAMYQAWKRVDKAERKKND